MLNPNYRIWDDRIWIKRFQKYLMRLKTMYPNFWGTCIFIISLGNTEIWFIFYFILAKEKKQNDLPTDNSYELFARY